MTFSWVIFGLNISLNYSVSTWLLQLGHSNSEDLLPNPEKHCCILVGLNSSGFLPYYWVVSEIPDKAQLFIPRRGPFLLFLQIFVLLFANQTSKQLKAKFYDTFHFLYFLYGWYYVFLKT